MRKKTTKQSNSCATKHSEASSSSFDGDCWQKRRQSSNPLKKLLIRISDIHSSGTNNSNAIIHQRFPVIYRRQLLRTNCSKQNDQCRWREDAFCSGANWSENKLKRKKHSTKPLSPPPSTPPTITQCRQTEKKTLEKYRFELSLFSQWKVLWRP